MEKMRIDKWLWCARFYKTRSLASEAIDKAQVRVNGDAVKPARDIRPGDSLSVRIGPVDVVFGEQGGKYPDGNYLTVQGTESRAGVDMPMVSRELPEPARSCDIVVLGHVHEDHTAGLDLLPDVPVHVHAGDVDALRSLEGLARHYGYSEAVTRAGVKANQRITVK